MTTKSAPRYKLSIRSLKFLSAVADPAQPQALTLLAKSEGDNVAFTARVVKMEPKLNLLFGWAWKSTIDGEAHHDLQGDQIVEDDSFLESACKFMLDAAPVDENHNEVSDGSRVVFAWPLTSELAKTFNIDTPDTGLMVGVKVTPDVMAKFADGTYKGWSIAGHGERELVKSNANADADTDDALAKHRASLDAQLAKQLEHEAYEANVIKSSHEWLDQVEREQGYETAAKFATTNKNSVGNWGATWLEKRTEAIAKGATSDDTILKSAEAKFEKARSEFDSYRSKLPIGKESLADARWMELAKAFSEAQGELAALPSKLAVAKFEKSIAEKRAAVEKMVEDFAVAHNLTPFEAQTRLAKISGTYQSAYADLANAQSEASAAAAGAQEKWEHDRQLATEKRASATAAANHARTSHETTGERAVRARVEELAKSWNLGYPQAMVRALSTDPTTQQLYEDAGAAKIATGAR